MTFRAVRTTLCAMIVSLAFGASAQAASKGVFYECDMTSSQRDSNWIAPKIGLVLFETGQAKIVDPWVLRYMDGPLDVTPRTPRKDLVRVSWVLSNITTNIGKRLEPIRYRMDLNTVRKTAKVWASWTVYDGARYNGEGTCKVYDRVPKLPGL